MIQRYSDEYTSGLPHDWNGRYVKYDDHEEELAACAAGPWRYDVENAPKDGTYIQGMFKNNHPLSTSGKSLIPGLWHKDEKCWDTMEGYFHQDDLVAFAVPNPPQVKP